MEITYSSEVFGLSNTKHLLRNASPVSGPAVLRWADDVAGLPLHNLMMWWAHHLRPDSLVWPLHTCSVWLWSGAPKIPLYCTEYNWPTTYGEVWYGAPSCKWQLSSASPHLRETPTTCWIHLCPVLEGGGGMTIITNTGIPRALPWEGVCMRGCQQTLRGCVGILRFYFSCFQPCRCIVRWGIWTRHHCGKIGKYSHKFLRYLW